MPPVKDLTQVLVGVAYLYVAPGSTNPVADTVAFGAQFPTPWKYVGSTDEGVQQGFDRDLTFHRVEEQSSPARVTINSSTISISTSLAEHTIENLKLALGSGTMTTVAPATGVVGKKTLTLSEDLDELAVTLEGKNAAGFWRRYYVPRVLSVASVEIANRRSEAKKLLPVTLQAICDINQIRVDDMTAAAL